jgi:hypothetical protein
MKMDEPLLHGSFTVQCVNQGIKLTLVCLLGNSEEGLPPGWASVVSRPPAPRHPDQAPPKHWLVFEVMDTGTLAARSQLAYDQ